MKTKLMIILTFLACTLSFTSCVEDNEAEIWFSGKWYVNGSDSNCPYDYNDVFCFYPGGRIVVSSNFYGEETGTWNISPSSSYGHDVMTINLYNSTAPTTIMADINYSRNSDVVVLDVTERDGNRYRIEIERSVYDYYSNKYKSDTLSLPIKEVK